MLRRRGRSTPPRAQRQPARGLRSSGAGYVGPAKRSPDAEPPFQRLSPVIGDGFIFQSLRIPQMVGAHFGKTVVPPPEQEFPSQVGTNYPRHVHRKVAGGGQHGHRASPAQPASSPRAGADLLFVQQSAICGGCLGCVETLPFEHWVRTPGGEDAHPPGERGGDTASAASSPPDGHCFLDGMWVPFPPPPPPLSKP